MHTETMIALYLDQNSEPLVFIFHKNCHVLKLHKIWHVIT